MFICAGNRFLTPKVHGFLNWGLLEILNGLQIHPWPKFFEVVN